jgi:hypothetical protein
VAALLHAMGSGCRVIRFVPAQRQLQQPHGQSVGNAFPNHQGDVALEDAAGSVQEPASRRYAKHQQQPLTRIPQSCGALGLQRVDGQPS